MLKQRPEISQGEIAEELGSTRRVIQKKILLKEAGPTFHVVTFGVVGSFAVGVCRNL